MKRLIGWMGLVFAVALAGPARSSDTTGEITGRVTVLSRDNQPVENNSGVVVYLREVNQNKGFIAPKTVYTMASENMEFLPEILPILAGSTVSFPNNDTMIHNAFSLSKTKPFDLGSYGQGPGKKVIFKTPGVVNVNCNRHPRMAGYIMVLGNPYFTLADEKGNFSLKAVPPGVYKIVSWFPYGFIQEKVVDLTKSPRLKVDFELVKIRDEVSHKNKFGKNY